MHRRRATTALLAILVGAPALLLGWQVLDRPRSEPASLAFPAPSANGPSRFDSDLTPDAAPALPVLLPPPAAAPAAGDIAIEPPPERFEGPPPAPVPPPRALASAPPASPSSADGGGVWSVVIGIDDYPGSSHDLRSAVNDANDVDEALARFGVPGSHRLVLRNGQARASIIARAADWLVSHAGPDATAVFFYAGHVRKLSSVTEAIVGADGDLLSDRALADRLQPLRAARSWIAIAGCYGGGFTEVLAPGRVLTAAADARSRAYENESFRRSYLVEYMVRQAFIQGAAPGSVQQAFAYAHAGIARDYPGREPVQFDQAGGPIDLRTRAAAGSGTGQAPAPQPAPAPAGGSPQPTTPPQDGCKSLTLGVVGCS
jgi:hypothetical protein